MRTNHLFFKALIVMAVVNNFGCNISKKYVDKSTVAYTLKQQQTIRELAESAVAYTYNRSSEVFRTDQLADKDLRHKFEKAGYGGLVIVNYQLANISAIEGRIDSTVVLRQNAIPWVTEIIYDFAEQERIFQDTAIEKRKYLFRKVANRIYYRRTRYVIPMM